MFNANDMIQMKTEWIFHSHRTMNGHGNGRVLVQVHVVERVANAYLYIVGALENLDTCRLPAISTWAMQISVDELCACNFPFALKSSFTTATHTVRIYENGRKQLAIFYTCTYAIESLNSIGLANTKTENANNLDTELLDEPYKG